MHMLRLGRAVHHRTLPGSTYPPARIPAAHVLCRAMFAGPGSDKLVKMSMCETACSKDTPHVPEAELPELLAAVPAWTHDTNKNMLIRKFVAKNFMAAIKYFNKVAEIAEAEGHHPDLHLSNYREVEVHVSTHAAKGVTLFDFVLAAKIDQVDVDYSPKWLQQEQERLQLKVAQKA